jgi:hypothetical protein
LNLQLLPERNGADSFDDAGNIHMSYSVEVLGEDLEARPLPFCVSDPTLECAQ